MYTFPTLKVYNNIQFPSGEFTFFIKKFTLFFIKFKPLKQDSPTGKWMFKPVKGVSPSGKSVFKHLNRVSPEGESIVKALNRV
jgi:hypothetical protein